MAVNSVTTDLMQDCLASIMLHISSHWLLCLTIIPVAITVCSILAHQAKPHNTNTPEPPVYPHLIPWLGHAISLATDITAFASKAKKAHPNEPINKVLIAGRQMYLVFSVKACNQIFRRTKSFTFDPMILLIFKALGSTPSDMKIFETGAHISGSLKPDHVAHGILHEMHNMHIRHLSGKSLEVITSKFMELLIATIDEQFPTDSNEWQTLDLCEFMKRAWTLAATKSLLGTEILEDWPGFLECFWTFDATVASLMNGWPRFLNRKAWENRDEGIAHLIQWEARALQAEEEGLVTGDPDWDPYWGMRYCRESSKNMIEKGLGEQGRSVTRLSLLWGLNANAVPIATMIAIKAVTDRKLMDQLLTEIREAQTGPVTLDIKKIACNSPRLKSVFLEVLRWGTAFSSPRIVTETNQISGYTLHQDSMLFISSRILHYDKEVWEVEGEKPADDFCAERFLDPEYRAAEVTTADTESMLLEHELAAATGLRQVEPLSGPKSKAIRQKMQSLRPFGGGMNLCPGRFFAANEILGGLAALLMRLEIEVVEEELKERGMPKPDLSTAKQGGLLPDRGLIIRMRRRVA